MEVNNSKLIDLLRFQLRRSITNLYKRYLTYYDDNLDFNTLRKKVLDDGNDAIRDVDELLQKLEDILNKR